MEQKDFVKTCWSVLKKHSFIRKGNNFHYFYESDFGLVYGLQKSIYGPYYYIEPAIYIKSINEFMPFPPFDGTEIRCARLTHLVNGKTETTFYYETLNEEEIVNVLEESIPIYINLVNSGKEGIRKCYLEKSMYLSLWRGAENFLELQNL